MMNLIRADLYRITRGKGIYITFAVVLIANFFLVFGMSLLINAAFTLAETVDPYAIVQIEEALAEAGIVEGYLDIQSMWPNTGWGLVEILMSASNVLLYFLLPLIIFTAGAIFDYGTVKNTLARGMCRTKLYISKLISISILCLILILFYMFTGMAMGALLGGMGTPAHPAPWLLLFQMIISRYIILLGAASVGTFLVFVLRRSGAAIGTFIAYFMITSFVFMIIGSVLPSLSWILNLELSLTMQRMFAEQGLSELAINIPAYMDTSDYIIAFGTAVFYMVVPTIAGLALFRKAEIK